MKLRTITDVMAECVEEGDCMLWQLGVGGSGVPYAWINGRSTNVRKYLLNLRRRECPAKAKAAVTCGNPRCLSAAHLVWATSSEIGRMAFAGGQTLAHRLAIVHGRRKVAKLTAQDVSEIRLSDEPASAVAQQFGVTRWHVARLRRFEDWKTRDQIAMGVE